MEHETIYSWHKNMLMDFSDLGICYSQDSISINPIEFDLSFINKLTVDLSKLAELARKVALKEFQNNVCRLRKDYIDIINIYKDSPRLPHILRPDGVVTNNQLKLLEINIDSGIGGILEMDFLQERLKCNPMLNEKKESWFPNPKTTLLEFLDEIRKSIVVCDAVNLALVGYSDYNQYYKDQGEDLCSSITKNTGFKAYFQFPELLRRDGDYITDGVRNYHVVYRDGALIHSPHKVAAMLKLISDTYLSKSILLSDPIDLLIEHKGILATLYEAKNDNKYELSNEERELIDAYVPRTYFISNRQVKDDKYRAFISIFDLLTKHQDEFVIKKCCSHAGENVYIGKEIEKTEWKNLVMTILNCSDENWIAQENLYSDKFEFNYILQDNKIVKRKQRYIFSPFVFGKKFGGALIRVERDSTNRVLSLPINNNMGAAGLVVV